MEEKLVVGARFSSFMFKELQDAVKKHEKESNVLFIKKEATKTWDASLASRAQKWTNLCDFKHQPETPAKFWGENLAAAYYTGGNNVVPLIDYMFQKWMDEKNFNTGGTFEECCCKPVSKCCHYTQVIWATSNQVGCGLTYCTNLMLNGQSLGQPLLFMACYYNPAGNTPVSRDGKFIWRPYE